MKLYIHRRMELNSYSYIIYNEAMKEEFLGELSYHLGLSLRKFKIINDESYHLCQTNLLLRIIETGYYTHCPYTLVCGGKYLGVSKQIKFLEHYKIGRRGNFFEMLKNSEISALILKNKLELGTLKKIEENKFMLDFNDADNKTAAILAMFCTEYFFNDCNKVKDKVKFGNLIKKRCQVKI